MNELQLYDLFNNIISKSKTMRRFVVAPGYGNNLNSNNLGEITNDVLGSLKDKKKYPLVIMMPPVEVINKSIANGNGWTSYRVSVYFFDSPNSKITNTSTNTPSDNVLKVWSRMSKSAKDFLRVLGFIEGNFSICDEVFRKEFRNDQKEIFLNRYSNVGNDVVAGVGIEFGVELFENCDITDYDTSDICN